MTSAQPFALLSHRAASPFDDAAAPGEAGAERAEQHPGARLQPAVVLRDLQRDGERRRRGVAEHLDAIDDALGVEAELLAQRPGDPRVGLVVDEQVDVLEAQARERDRFERRLAHARDRVTEHLVPVHLDLPRRQGGEQRARVRSVRAEDDRPDGALPGLGDAEHDRARRVGEQRRALLVVVVDDPGDEVRADQQHAVGPPALDLRGAERQAGEERRARGADVDRARVACPERVGDDRRRVRRQLVLRERRHDHQIDLRRLHAGGVERLLAGARGVVAEPLVGLGAAALADPGPGEDPVLGDPESLGDLGVRELALRKLARDRQDRGGPLAGLALVGSRRYGRLKH